MWNVTIPEALRSRILDLARETLQPHRRQMAITDGMRLKEDIFLNSIGIINFITRIEDEFDLELVGNLESLSQVQSYGDFLAFAAIHFKEGEKA